MELKTNAKFVRYHQITKVIKDNLYLLKKCDTDQNADLSSLVGFNNRILISDCEVFLQAVKKEIGGEILLDPEIGYFLYYGEN